ncbi:hypothetical protein ACFOU2_16240 [Bacillus songklensis]|uniref:Uncharacterized protein n=1 Tax=Bacillus songklensis TaxID=1069116 RepID=A0ABV8B5H1_9BACI
MPNQDHKPPRISDNYAGGSSWNDADYLDTGAVPPAQARESLQRPNSILNRGMEIAGNSIANREGLSNRI